MLTLESFATKLLQTEDLDPVYVSVHRVQPSWGVMSRLLLAYWCFYHLGAAAFIAEHGDTPRKFWSLMHKAAANVDRPVSPDFPAERWPRASERRHFRGDQAILAVKALELASNEHRRAGRENDPEGLFNWLVGAGTRTQTFTQVRDRALSLRGFGPWIAFKVADMTERVVGIPVDFSDCGFGVYDDPRKGAALAALVEDGYDLAQYDIKELLATTEITDQGVQKMMDLWAWKLRKFKAPPRADRKVGVQEIETIFCKYKSHAKGHYEPGKDTLENIESLHGWGSLARQLRVPMVELGMKHWSWSSTN